MTEWHLYMVRTRDGALYTGTATDVDRRLSEHEKAGSRGARYLCARGRLQLAYEVGVGSRAFALRPERRVKRLAKQAKERIVAGAPCGPVLLARLNLLERGPMQQCET